MTARRLQAAGAPTEVDVDVDALRAARGETETRKSFRLGGQVFTVPAKLPIYVGVYLARGQTREAIRTWLGDAQEERFATIAIDDDEFGELLRLLYRVGTGESSASPTT